MRRKNRLLLLGLIILLELILLYKLEHTIDEPTYAIEKMSNRPLSKGDNMSAF